MSEKSKKFELSLRDKLRIWWKKRKKKQVEIGQIEMNAEKRTGSYYHKARGSSATFKSSRSRR